jgi:hypothetical protein
MLRWSSIDAPRQSRGLMETISTCSASFAPAGARDRRRSRIHELRCASLVATFRGPFGANDDRLTLVKRQLLKLAVFLLLLAGGAIVNVAVAWGCALMWTLHDIEEQPTFWLEYDLGWRTTGNKMLLVQSLAPNSRNSSWIHVNGWPMDSIIGARHNMITGRHFACALPAPSSLGLVVVESPDAKLLPLRPIWPGFAINTIFYAAILAILFYGPGKVRRFVRVRRGRCPACAYPVGSSPVCTECGAPLVRTRK